MSMRSTLTRLAKDEGGATLVEYCLIIGVLSMGIIVAISTFANSTGAMWTHVNNNLALVW